MARRLAGSDVSFRRKVKMNPQRRRNSVEGQQPSIRITLRRTPEIPRESPLLAEHPLREGRLCTSTHGRFFNTEMKPWPPRHELKSGGSLSG
jgi:hypothetical protein